MKLECGKRLQGGKGLGLGSWLADGVSLVPVLRLPSGRMRCCRGDVEGTHSTTVGRVGDASAMNGTAAPARMKPAMLQQYSGPVMPQNTGQDGGCKGKLRFVAVAEYGRDDGAKVMMPLPQHPPLGNDARCWPLLDNLHRVELGDVGLGSGRS